MRPAATSAHDAPNWSTWGQKSTALGCSLTSGSTNQNRIMQSMKKKAATMRVRACTCRSGGILAVERAAACQADLSGRWAPLLAPRSPQQMNVCQEVLQVQLASPPPTHLRAQRDVCHAVALVRLAVQPPGSHPHENHVDNQLYKDQRQPSHAQRDGRCAPCPEAAPVPGVAVGVGGGVLRRASRVGDARARGLGPCATAERERPCTLCCRQVGWGPAERRCGNAHRAAGRKA